MSGFGPDHLLLNEMISVHLAGRYLATKAAIARPSLLIHKFEVDEVLHVNRYKDDAWFIRPVELRVAIGTQGDSIRG
jgi:hypothetical protein